ncbi:MAG: MarR family transcriptional regulator [Propionibacteriales bacterium]|nr:MarR family transcriptional regulator [Propionibacteriales bacterium]
MQGNRQPSSPEEAVYLLASHVGRQMKRRYPGDLLDTATWPVLFMLQCHGDLRLSDLAGKLQLDQSTVSRHVKHLQDRGFVERTEDPGDRRAALLHISPAGADALEQGRQRRREKIAAVLQHWPVADAKEFAAYATRFTDDLLRTLDDEGSR